MKIAILSSGNLSDMKGIMNFVQEEAARMVALQASHSIKVDVYIIRKTNSFFLSLLKTRQLNLKEFFGKREEPKTYQLENVTYNLYWINYGLWDNLTTTKLKKKLIGSKHLKQLLVVLEKYDIIISHTLICHSVASYVREKRHIPYIAIWHGSDINIDPFISKWMGTITRQTLENAACNYFVSRNLLEASDKITTNCIKEVIYTGPSSVFTRASDKDILEYKNKYKISKEIIVGFVGNIIDVKNVLSLPLIMAELANKDCSRKYILWVAGNGNQESILREDLNEKNIPYRLFGKMNPNEVPLFISCLDVLVLPSKNEGLGLVLLEARKCGVNAVASDVGGQKEVIGEENCYPLDNNFASNIATRIIEIISSKEKPKPLDYEFSWEAAIDKLCNKCKEILCA